MNDFDILHTVFEITDEIKERVSDDVAKALTLFNKVDTEYRWLITHGTEHAGQPKTLEELIAWFQEYEDNGELDRLIEDLEDEAENNPID